MQALRTLLLILIAATIAVGGTARAMPMPAAEPPCHEAPASPDEQTSAQLAVNCCVGCMPAPCETATILAVAAAEPTDYTIVQPAIEGRLTAPDPHPPRSSV
ncbi:MAG: hypothetical protein Q8J89_11890 [Caulobacter sp.]|nr:hypothetical protein [Caulobacter sp.]